MLVSRNLYSLADKVDRIAQNTFSFKSDQELTNYLNSIVGKNGINTMTGFDIETKKFIIKECPKYEISITKNTKTNIVEIVINDL